MKTGKELKLLIQNSEYTNSLLEKISQVKDYNNVSEMLYYEAVFTYRYLRNNNFDQELCNILKSFILMCNASQLKKDSDFSLFSLRANILKEDLEYKKKLFAILVGISTMLLFLLVLESTSLADILTATIYILAADYLIYQTIKGRPYILSNTRLANDSIVSDINYRTKCYLDLLDNKALLHKFNKVRPQTEEYYELCAEIELAYLQGN